MLTPLTRKRSPLLAWLGVAVSAVLLTACGGGGGGGSSSSGGGGGSSGSTSGTVTLSGVAATGAPVIGGTITVLDANGANCGTASTALADGTYTLALSCTSPTMPLLLEAVGVDMSGAPIVLHSLVQSVTSGTGTSNSVQINPLTNAVVALLMGGEPTAFFQGGKASATGSAAVRSARWSLLGSSASLNVASDFVKTVIRANLNDARMTTAALVNFFSDNTSFTFTANKTGLDAAIEGLRIQFGRSNTGDELLQLSNRLLPPCSPGSACNASTNLGSPEVIVNLTTARSGLNSATPAIASTATISTAKTTTSTSALMSPVSDLEGIRAAINNVLRPTTLATDIATLNFTNSSNASKPVFASTYSQQDGNNALAVAGILAAYGASNYQLSSFMIAGCLDYPILNRCTKVRITSMVRDGSGNIRSIFENTANYVAASSSWSLVGNGRQVYWAIYPSTWLYLNGDGSTLSTSASGPNPGQGIQTTIRSIDSVTPLISDVTTSSGTTVHFYNCNSVAGDPMCLSNQSSTGYETGDLVLDQILPTTNTSWLGPTDSRPGTRFQNTSTGIGVGETTTLILPADLPATSNQSAYPVIDGLSVSAPLLHANLEAGVTISWATWAAANPGLRVVEVRAVIMRPTPFAPTKQVFSINPLAATQITIPAFSSVPSDATEDSVWLIAQDAVGRRYITKIVAL